jgi:hypothetical protein
MNTPYPLIFCDTVANMTDNGRSQSRAGNPFPHRALSRKGVLVIIGRRQNADHNH